MRMCAAFEPPPLPPRPQAAYIALLQPKQLATVFKSSITAPTLTAMLRVALAAIASSAGSGGSSGSAGSGEAIVACSPGSPLSAAHAVELLRALPSVPRFGMAAMCIGSKERQELARMWDNAAAAAASMQLAEGLSEQRTAFRL